MTQVDCPHVSGVFVQGGEDVIHVNIEGDPEVVNNGQPSHIGLQVDDNITWIKRIRFLDDNGVEIATVNTQDNQRGPFWFHISGGVSSLELCKAKGLGFVTGMYQVSLGGFPFIPGGHGRRILFIWRTD